MSRETNKPTDYYISLNALLDKFSTYSNIFPGSQPPLALASSIAEKLPKYDAIPVDWIISYATETCVDKDGTKYLTFERNCIDTMLEEWRKLNEGQ